MKPCLQGVIAALLLARMSSLHADEPPVLAKPSPEQLALMDRETGVFFHFSLSTFTGQDHGDGKHPPSQFNPTALDCEQWARTAKAMGAHYAVLTARHEDGFCLWPTAMTDYSIKNSPYKNGKGDIVREFVNACRKYGLKPGLYFSAAYDGHHNFKDAAGKTYLGDDHGETDPGEDGPEGQAKFAAIQTAELTELLTNYGEISYIWCDHWGSGDIWRAATDTMRKLQPHCLMMGPDTTTPGNENGDVVYPMWNAIDTQDGTPYSRGAKTKVDRSPPNTYGLLETDVLTGNPFGKFWRNREADTNTAFETGGWFWHPGKTSARAFTDHGDLYDRTVGLGANLIVNLPPDQRGLIQDDLVAAAKDFGDQIDRRYGHPVAASDRIPAGDTFELAWDQPARIDTVVLMENIADGQKIAGYALEAMVGGRWIPLKPVTHFPSVKPPYNANPDFETIGHKKIDHIEPVTTNRIRFRCVKSIEQPVELRHMAVFAGATPSQP